MSISVALFDVISDLEKGCIIKIQIKWAYFNFLSVCIQNSLGFICKSWVIKHIIVTKSSNIEILDKKYYINIY